jgi:hypothetical protein
MNYLQVSYVLITFIRTFLAIWLLRTEKLDVFDYREYIAENDNS